MLMKFRNIGLKGRLIRGAAGVVMGVAAVWIGAYSLVAGAALGLGAAFLLFEAVAGWCGARACGIKTPF